MDEEPYFEQLEEQLKQLGKESGIPALLAVSDTFCKIFDRFFKSSDLEQSSDEEELQVERKKYIKLRKIMNEAFQTIQKKGWGRGIGEPYNKEKEKALNEIKKRIDQTQEEIDVLAKELSLKHDLEDKEMKKEELQIGKKENKISVWQIIITLILFVCAYFLGKYT